MNRRESIKGLAMSLGYVVAAPTVVSILESCAKKNETWPAVFLNEKEQHFITDLVDIILPVTDTPGGLDVNLPQFIDMMANDVLTADEQQIFKEGSDIFSKRFKTQFGKDIGDSDKNETAKLFGSYFDVSKEKKEGILKVQSANFAEVLEKDKEDFKIYKFLLSIRSLSLLGYFTSEKIGTEVLTFDPIPGRYEPCKPISEVGNAWTI